jgi:hypothetical protein
MRIKIIPLVLSIPLIVAADSGVITDFPTLLNGITKFLSEVCLALLSLPIIFGAYQLITAGGDPQKVSNGKKMIIYAFIGVSILLIANGAVSLIIQVIQRVS